MGDSAVSRTSQSERPSSDGESCLWVREDRPQGSIHRADCELRLDWAVLHRTGHLPVHRCWWWPYSIRERRVGQRRHPGACCFVRPGPWDTELPVPGYIGRWKAHINKIRVQKTRLKSKNITKLGEYLVEKVTVEGVSVWYHHTALCIYIYGNDSNKVIIYRTGRLRESDVQAHPWPRRENGNLRGRWRFFWSPFSPMLIVWEYNFCLHFYNLYSAQNGESNQRHLSRGFKNILFRDRGPNMHYIECFL